ncbi:MAG TPA: filamentous hemagglutinin N-terminal domain-containing protein [Negativicutes bacterium]|nr:filamentous hemagglutinin N-terminal domain-containing protein [Negativicutes bacterium]
MKRKWQRGWQREKTNTATLSSSTTTEVVAAKSGNWAKKLLAPLTVASLLLLQVSIGYANPTSGVITAGSGSISQTGTTTTVTQNTGKMSVNWQSFNINSNEAVNFVQPSAASIALNRIVGNSASNIYGQLNANGQVFLINPNGVLFAPGAQVNVGGLVASSLNLSDSDFLAGKYNFNGSTGSVVNHGTITAANKGYVALLGAQVSNQGIIVANQGTVALGAGSAVTLDLAGDGLLNLAVNGATLQALVENKNLIQANGGQVIMTARAADTLAGTVVNNTGIVQAQRINNANGVIVLDGGTNGIVSVSGTLDASGAAAGQTGGTVKVLGNTVAVDNATINASGDAGGGTVLIGGNWQGKGNEHTAANTTVGANTMIRADALTSGNGGKIVVWADNSTNFGGRISAKGGANGGDGGSVETSGHKTLTVSDSARVNTLAPKGKAGSWLLDPNDVTIAAAGGTISGSTIATNLQTGNVEIDTATSGTAGGNGDVFINDNIITSSDLTATRTLTLKAERDITLAAGKSIDATQGGNTQKLNVILWSNSANTGGSIAIGSYSGSTATIKSNGGDITLSGGSDLTTGYALGRDSAQEHANGVFIGNATLNSNGGNILIRGKGAQVEGQTSGGGVYGALGVWGYGTNSPRIDSGTGTISITGYSQGTTTMTANPDAPGFGWEGNGVITSANTTAAAITIVGDARAANTNDWPSGMRIKNTTISATNGGGITLIGYGGTTPLSNPADGIRLNSGAKIISTSGPITLTGTKGTGNASSADIALNGGTITSTTGDITLNADILRLETTSSTLGSSGALNIKPRTVGTSVGISGGAGTLSLPATYFTSNFVNGFSQITIGRTDAGKITIGGSTTLNDATAIVSGDDITINGAVNASGQTVALTGGNGKTVSGSGNITAGSLLLNGTGASYNLNTASGNSVGTLAANGVADVKFINNGALTIGTVGAVSGITATGLVDIETTSGDLTVAKNIATTNATPNAIMLASGTNTAAGTAGGGDIKVSGTPAVSTGAGGRAVLYSGSLSGSTALPDLIGIGSGKFRYNSSKSVANYTTALGASGIYAIYREQPTITVTANNDSKTYSGLAYSGGNGASVSGLANGDAASSLSGTLAYSGTSQGAINVNSYVITPSGYSNGLGYALTYADGTLTVSKAPLSVTANNDSKTYSGLAYSGGNGVSYSGLVNSETPSVLGGVLSYSGTSQGAVNTGAYSIIPGGLTSGNYSINFANGTLTIRQNVAQNDAYKGAIHTADQDPGNNRSKASPPSADPSVGALGLTILPAPTAEIIPASGSLVVYSVDNGQQQVMGAYQLNFGKDGLKLSGASQPAAVRVEAPTVAGKGTNLEIALTNGEIGRYFVSVVDNSLIIQPVNDSARNYLLHTDSTDNKPIVTAGMMAVLHDLGVNPGSIQSVFIYKK